MRDGSAALTAAAERMLGGVTENDLAAVEKIRGYVALWESGDATLADIRRETTGRQRAIAILTMKLDDPLRPAMKRLTDALVDTAEGDHGDIYYRTPFGILSHSEVAEHGGRIGRDDKGVYIEFPIEQPWLRKPAPDVADHGEKAPPVFRRDLTGGGIAASPRVARQDAPPRRESPDNGRGHLRLVVDASEDDF